MSKRLILIPITMVGAVLAMAVGGVRSDEPQFTRDFGLRPGVILLAEGDNPYFPLRPGRFFRLEGWEDDEFVEVEMTVLPQTRRVGVKVGNQRMLVTTRVVEEREWVDGELEEVSLNYFAYCPSSGSVFHFGEDVELYEEGQVVSTEGSWLADS